MDAGFVKAESTNLPRIDALMVGEFVALNPDFCSAEQRNDKASICNEMEAVNAENNSKAVEIKFKPIYKRNLRQRVKEEESDDEEHILAKLEETKELQKLRERPNGVSVIALASGEKTSIEDEVTCKDTFKVKSGGMVNMQALKSGKVKQVDDAYDTGRGTQFSAETNKRDEDEEMMKYIEEQLAKRKRA
ncbi:hypothetical protein evm_004133 [Chilo suppressalis]|nr:hypothetical protein evm_004133 [Chilo suppressalis]